ncbi:unnamed protein product [Phaedon cochleariae]|uniref:Transmembrane protein n=1 Tax=Phaedon cochleariae TaxID=80249 RepID=A0A9P0GRY8_PHACE|nr:unnamed protein product [Phaedon cochleariae]
MFPSFHPGTRSENDPANGRVSGLENVDASGQKNSEQYVARFFDGLLVFTRCWSILSAIVLAGVGVDLVFHRHRAGYYFIGISTFVLVTEVLWVVTLFLRICIRSDSRIWKFWSAVTWFCGWKKTIAYSPLGAIPLLWPHDLWLSYVAGGLLITLAALHLVLSFKDRRKGQRKKKDRLLSVDIDSFESSKFEDVTECLDDGFPEPIPGSSHSISDSLAHHRQETVIEI